jgi:hypothetical protein
MFGLEGVKRLLRAVQELDRERVELRPGFERVAVEEVRVVEEAVAYRVDCCEALHAVWRDASCEPGEALDEGEEGEHF